MNDNTFTKISVEERMDVNMIIMQQMDRSVDWPSQICIRSCIPFQLQSNIFDLGLYLYLPSHRGPGNIVIHVELYSILCNMRRTLFHFSTVHILCDDHRESSQKVSTKTKTFCTHMT